MAKTRVAVLGTLGHLHETAVAYDLATLRRLVREIEPDLLCAEIRARDWASHDLRRAGPEYTRTLLPLSRRTDIVVVPVGAPGEPELVVPRGSRLLRLRKLLVRFLNWHLGALQRMASSPRAINSGPWGTVCDGLCTMTAWICGREALEAWDSANRAILENVLAAVRRDPGRRVLVTVDCRRRHRLERSLREVDTVEVVDHRHL